MLRSSLQAMGVRGNPWQFPSPNCPSKAWEAEAFIAQCPHPFGWKWCLDVLTPGCIGAPGRVIPCQCWRSPGDRNEEGSLCLRQKHIVRCEWKLVLNCPPRGGKIRGDSLRTWALELEALGALCHTGLLERSSKRC